MDNKILIILGIVFLMNSVNAIELNLTYEGFICDTYTHALSPTTSYNTGTNIYTGNITNNEARAYYDLNISIYEGFRLNFSELYLYVNPSEGNGTYNLYWINDNTYPCAVTWNTQPNYTISGTLINTTIITIDSTDYYKFQIKDAINYALNEGLNNCRLMIKEENNTKFYLTINTNEGAIEYRPHVYGNYYLPNYTFNGTIKDGVSLNNLSGAYIKITNSTGSIREDITETNGYFEFLNMKEGDYDVYISLTNYDTLKTSVSITNDTTETYNIYLTSAGINLTIMSLSFLTPNYIPFTGELISFEYIDGCPLLIGNLYEYTTNSDGKIIRNFPKGTYKVYKNNYLIRQYDVYQNYIESDFYLDTSKTFYMKYLNATYNMSFKIVNYNTNLPINNSEISLVSDKYVYNGNTNNNGEISFMVLEDNYRLFISKYLYYDYPCSISYLDSYGVHLLFDENENIVECYREIDIFENKSETIELKSFQYNKFAIGFMVLDGYDHSYIGEANIYLQSYEFGSYENKTTPTGENYTYFYNLSVGNYYYWATKNGFISEYPNEKLPIAIESNATVLLYLYNNSEVKFHILIVDELNNTPAIYCRLMSIDTYGYNVLKQTNTTGSTVFTDLMEYWNYDLECSKTGYYTEFKTISIYEENITYNFTLLKSIPKYTYSGIVYYQDTTLPIPSVTISINNTLNQSVLSGVNGYFEFNNLGVGKYKILLNKTGFFPLNSEFEIINKDIIDYYEMSAIEDLYLLNIYVFTNESLPLGDSSITISNSEINIFEILSTNEKGLAQIKLPKTMYNIEIEKDGYNTFIGQKRLDKENAIWTFRLEKIEIGSFSFGEMDFFSFVGEFFWLFLAIILMLLVIAIITMEARIILGKDR